LIVRTIVSVLFAVVALALRQRRSADPIALRISFAFVLMAQMNPAVENYWRSSGASGTSYLAGIVGVLILGAVVPAFSDRVYAHRWGRGPVFPVFPDGVSPPRWARGLRVVLPLGVVIAAIASLLGQAVLAGLLV